MAASVGTGGVPGANETPWEAASGCTSRRPWWARARMDASLGVWPGRSPLLPAAWLGTESQAQPCAVSLHLLSAGQGAGSTGPRALGMGRVRGEAAPGSQTGGQGTHPPEALAHHASCLLGPQAEARVPKQGRLKVPCVPKAEQQVSAGDTGQRMAACCAWLVTRAISRRPRGSWDPPVPRGRPALVSGHRRPAPCPRRSTMRTWSRSATGRW